MTDQTTAGAATPPNAVDRGIAEAMRVYEAVPQFSRLRQDTLLGDVWLQPELTPRDRSMITCTILAVAGKMDELGAHLRRAVENGVTLDEIRGMIVQIAFYAGWPTGLALGKAALPMLEAGRPQASAGDC